MIDDTSTLPVPIAAAGVVRVSTVAQLAEIPEEDIWLAKQKSARTRRAYKLDVQHFMRTLGIEDIGELRQADHKAVIAWERFMRETEHAAASTIRRRLAALSSLYKAPGPPRPRRAQSRRRGRFDPRLRQSAGPQRARRSRRSPSLAEQPTAE
jgi:integrase family protein with SAM-like domain